MQIQQVIWIFYQQVPLFLKGAHIKHKLRYSPAPVNSNHDRWIFSNSQLTLFIIHHKQVISLLRDTKTIQMKIKVTEMAMKANGRINGLVISTNKSNCVNYIEISPEGFFGLLTFFQRTKSLTGTGCVIEMWVSPNRA